jgi:putative Holliday junction resolvase
VARVLALDLGTRRIGVAVSDPGAVLATPLTVVARRGDRVAEHRDIAALVAEHQAERVLVGLPRSLDGGLGPAARAALAECDELAASLSVPVEPVDERFTTVTAHQRLRQSRARRRPASSGAVDQAAAAVLLQAWLDGRAKRTEQG